MLSITHGKYFSTHAATTVQLLQQYNLKLAVSFYQFDPVDFAAFAADWSISVVDFAGFAFDCSLTSTY